MASGSGGGDHGLFEQGVAHHQAGRLQQAEALYRRILASDPHHAGAWNLLGVIAFQSGQNALAIDYTSRAIRLDARAPDYYNNLGNALLASGHPAEAEISFRTALVLKPAYADAQANLGNALRSLGRPREAEACYRESLRLKPRQPETHNNLGNALKMLGRQDEAEASFRKAIRLRPDFADAHNNLGHLLLLQGRLVEGWPEFEWRWRTQQVAFTRKFMVPCWTGEPLAGRTLLIHAEQGLGDTLQFCRYVPGVAAAVDGPVVFEVQPPLERLVASLAGDIRVVTPGGPTPAYDLHCPLLSLPGILGVTLEAISSSSSEAYLRADAQKTAVWRERLAALPGLKVGLVWAGGARLDQPLVEQINRRRSITLQAMAPLAAAANVSFVSLQKDGPAAEAQTPPAGMRLADFTDELVDFADTAALVSALDLVISVDTAVAHLAGALDRPVWLLNRFDTCWRWFEDRRDSPWYDRLLQFRQPAPGDWDAVMQAAAHELIQLGGQAGLRNAAARAVAS